MSVPPRTRKASKDLSRYKQKASLAQQILALRRVIVWEDSFRTACELVNEQSGTLAKEHVITTTTLHRLYHSLPDTLHSPLHASEGALLNFLQEQQSAQRANLSRSQSLLTQLEEELLAQWLVEMAKINLPLDAARVIEEARRIIELHRGTAPTTSLVWWWRNFRKRHAGLTERICQDISKQRITAQQNKANIANYFRLLSAFRDLPPSQIYAGDETGLDGDGARRPKVITQCGVARVTQELDSYREHTSLMHIGNAAGETLPMIFIFKGQQIDQAVLPLLPANALVGCQENGYFTGQNFLRILQHLDQHGSQQRPLLFIVDGAKGHIDLAAIDYARSKQINILCLPSQTTHLLQVADVALFGPFKQYWKAECEELKRERGRSVSDEKRGIRRADIVPLAVRAWSLAMTPENVQAGFRRTGIYPYDPTAYKQTKEQRLKSLGGLPLLVSPIHELAVQPAVGAAVDLLPVRVLTPVKPTHCGECGSKLKKRVVRRTLSTAAGALLTGDEARQQVKEAEERKKAEETEKQRRREARAAQKKEKEEAGKGERSKQTGRKRKAAEASVEEEDKENAHPNIAARPLVFDPRMFGAGITVVSML